MLESALHRVRLLQAGDRFYSVLKPHLEEDYLLGGMKICLEVHTDANYAGSIIDGKSTSGYYLFLGGNLETWRSKKQNVIAQASAEAKFRVMAQGVLSCYG